MFACLPFGIGIIVLSDIISGMQPCTKSPEKSNDPYRHFPLSRGRARVRLGVRVRIR